MPEIEGDEIETDDPDVRVEHPLLEEARLATLEREMTAVIAVIASFSSSAALSIHEARHPSLLVDDLLHGVSAPDLVIDTTLTPKELADWRSTLMNPEHWEEAARRMQAMADKLEAPLKRGGEVERDEAPSALGRIAALARWWKSESRSEIRETMKLIESEARTGLAATQAHEEWEVLVETARGPTPTNTVGNRRDAEEVARLSLQDGERVVGLRMRTISRWVDVALALPPGEERRDG